MTIEYDAQLAADTERSYLMPEIVLQRAQTLAALHLQAGEKVLDVGCGMGLLTQDIALAVGPTGCVVGVDNSSDMLALAKHRCTSLPQVTLKEQSVVQLQEPDDQYDALTCTQLLLYLPDVPAALQEMWRVLKPGGRIAIVETDWQGTLFNSDDQRFVRQLFDQWEASVPSPHLPGQLRGLLLAQGFTAVSVTAIPLINTSYLPDNYSGSMAHYMTRSQFEAGQITQTQANNWLTELQERSENGRYFFCVNRFLFTAVKGG
ncbi:MAG: methyltransferase domain-containing protein [Chloroflexota bacterium]